jgi:sugar lactone lactonase YvrE
MFLKLAGRRTLIVMATIFLLLAVLCPALTAQTIVTSQAVPLNNPKFGSTQLWKAVISSKGDVIASDFQSNAVYQFPADGGPVRTLTGQSPNNAFSKNQWAIGNVTIDDQDNLYIATRWAFQDCVKIPYDPVEKTWHIVHNADTIWGAGAGTADTPTLVPMEITFAKNDPTGNGHFFLSDDSNKRVVQYSGSGHGKLVVGGLKARVTKMAADQAGNLYIMEDLYNNAGVQGTFRIPAGTYDLMGATDGNLELGWPACGSKDAFKQNGNTWTQLPCRVDNALGWGQNALAVDSTGNVIIGDGNDSFGPSESTMASGGIFRVPVENFYLDNGAITTTPTATLLGAMPNPAHQILLAPISPQGSPVVDPKGNIYIPVGDGGWNCQNSVCTAYEMVKVYLGSAAIPAGPLGQQGTSSAEIMYSINAPITPDGFTFTQDGKTGTDFAVATGGTCNTGQAYTPNQRCTLNVAMNSQAVGLTSGMLAMTQGGTPVSTTFVHGTGLGPALSVLTPAAETAIHLASGSAAKQVATDRWGNFYVADASGTVLQYAHGSGASSTPTPISGTFTAPTGVAVDGAGNVFVADSGNVFEIPVSGGGQTVVQTGLGANLNLATDGAGNVFVADTDNKRIVKIANPTSRLLTTDLVTIGTGFTSPTAVTTDDAGNVYVVDGPALIKIVPGGAQTLLVNGLASPTGVALDPSGAIYVAQQDGVVRIPNINGALDFTSKINVGQIVSVPNSVAVDPFGTVYMTDGETPGVVVVGPSGALDFGFVKVGTTGIKSASLFNIGNQDLTLVSPVYQSTVGSTVIGLVAAQDQCSGQSVAAGGACNVGFGMTPTGTGTAEDSGTLQSNAANGQNGEIAIGLTGIGSNSQDSKIASITYTPAQPVYPSDVTVTVTVAAVNEGGPVPTGKVVLTVDNQPTKAVVLDSNATSSFTLRKPLGGSHAIVASYQGDANYASVSATLDPPLTIGLADSTVTVSKPAQVPGLENDTYHGYYVAYQGGYKLPISVTSPAGTPTKKVFFTEGATQLGSANLDGNGEASFDTGSLPIGPHIITVTYGGDTNTKTSSANSVQFYVTPPSVVLTTDTPTLTLKAGVAGGATMVLHPINGYHNSVQLACDKATLPQYSECTFDWPTVNMQDSLPETVVVTISTNVPVNVVSASNTRPATGLLWPASTLAIGLVGLVFGKKTKYNGRLLMIVCALLVIASATVGLSACSGSSYTKTPDAPHVATPSGTQSVIITATDSATGSVASLPFQLNVTVQ